MTSHLTTLLLNLFTAAGYVGVVIAMAIESCCIPLPSELIMPLAGFLASEGKLSLVGTGLAGAVGCVVGSSVAYWIGAVGGRPLLLKYGRYIMISEADALRADEYFARWGDLTVFITRLMPIVRTFISLPAGIARMDFRKFLLYTFLGSLPWCYVLAFAGYKLGQNWDQVGPVLHRFDLLIGVAVVVLIGWFIYRHRRTGTRVRQSEQG